MNLTNYVSHILRRSLRSIWENLYLNTMSSLVIAASLLLLGVYVSVQVNLNNIVDTWNRDVHVSAYFAADITEAERLNVLEEIHALPEATKVVYVSEEEAEEWLSERVDGIDESLNLLGDNALPSSLEITLSSEYSQPEEIKAFASKIQRAEFESIDYGVEWVKRFNAFLQLLKALGTMLGILILLFATFLVTNTINLVVYNRKDELEITRLVGGADLFIMLPFLFEGAMQGLIGGLASICGLWVIHTILTTRIQDALALQIAGELQFLPFLYLLLLVCIGMLLGLTAAFIATKRFLGKTSS
ncbi:MAG: hypothetical protein CMK59_12310 [Proteobacteria bacterium]|nr:hypothetical protein [Pseudomonadota bacterium]